MRYWRTLGIALLLAAAACSQAGKMPEMLPLLGTHAAAGKPAYGVLYQFRGGKDGYYPSSSLVAVKGAVYGTTQYGGGTRSAGTVFKIDLATGKETVLYRFKGGVDGEEPQFGLTYFNGALYGTTALGGVQTGPCGGSCGTVFAVSLAGKKRTVLRFNAFNGSGPTGNLVAYNGKLYGTAGGGGCTSSGKGGGVVFSIDRTGKERIVYLFCPTSTYAPLNPVGGVVPYNGYLYGVTTSGGASCPTQTTCGEVYRVSRSGQKQDLYRFKGGADGKSPYGLMSFGGNFYGTTQFGGSSRCEFGCGVVFSVAPSGSERVVYRFRGGRDGSSPRAAPIALGGLLYGTTAYGGASGCSSGCGTVFSVTPGGVERVLHAFVGGSDGSTPVAAPVPVGKTLYGTTVEFSGSACCGTVYQLTP